MNDEKLTKSLRETFKAFFVDTLDDEELAMTQRNGVIIRKPDVTTSNDSPRPAHQQFSDVLDDAKDY